LHWTHISSACAVTVNLIRGIRELFLSVNFCSVGHFTDKFVVQILRSVGRSDVCLISSTVKFIGQGHRSKFKVTGENVHFFEESERAKLGKPDSSTWRKSLVVRALHSRLDGRQFDSRLPRLVLASTVFVQANHLGISPSHLAKLSLLSSAGRKISIGQSTVMLCGWGVKGRMAHSTCG